MRWFTHERFKETGGLHSAQWPLRCNDVTVDGFHAVARLCVSTGLIPGLCDCTGRAYWRSKFIAYQGVLPVFGCKKKRRFLQTSDQDAVVRQGRTLLLLLQRRFPDGRVIHMFIAIPVCVQCGTSRKKHAALNGALLILVWCWLGQLTLMLEGVENYTMKAERTVFFSQYLVIYPRGPAEI